MQQIFDNEAALKKLMSGRLLPAADVVQPRGSLPNLLGSTHLSVYGRRFLVVDLQWPVVTIQNQIVQRVRVSLEYTRGRQIRDIGTPVTLTL